MSVMNPPFRGTTQSPKAYRLNIAYLTDYCKPQSKALILPYDHG
jgi:hypothetical protein